MIINEKRQPKTRYNHQGMNDMTIYLSYDEVDEEPAMALAAYLNKNQYQVIADRSIDPKAILGVVMTGQTKPESLIAHNPWIQQQFLRSSVVGLRVLPLVIYDSGKEDLEQVWENVEKIYSVLFSEEFKPYAFDLAKKEESLVEFTRVIEEYYEE